MTTAHVAGGDATVVVTATGLGLLLEQRRVRAALVQFLTNDLDDVATTGGCGFSLDDCHDPYSCPYSAPEKSSSVSPAASVTYALR